MQIKMLPQKTMIPLVTGENYVTFSCQPPGWLHKSLKIIENRHFDHIKRVQNKIKKKLTGDTVFAIVAAHTVNADNRKTKK
jgi:hypothetical protein